MPRFRRFQEPSDLIVAFVNDGGVTVHSQDNIALHNFIAVFYRFKSIVCYQTIFYNF